MSLLIAHIAGLEWMEKTMTTNAEWLQKKGYKFKDLRIYINFSNDKKWDYGIKIAKTNVNVHVKGDGPLNALTRWLDAEHVDPILDDVEKRYLSALIRPFRNEIKFIEKDRCFGNRLERLYFYMKDDEIFYFKLFKMGTMYKGMKPKKTYTLEELGL